MESLRILLVEDNYIIADDIASKLTSQGYNIVKMVDTGEKCLLFLEKYAASVDLILMDISLKTKMTGIEAAEQIQAKKYNIPIIYLTNHKEKDIFQKAKKTMPANFLHKPFTIDALSNAIELAFFNASQVIEKTLHSNNLANKTENKPGGYFINDSFFIRKSRGSGFIKVAVENVIWIEAHQAYCIIQTKEESHMLAINTTEFERRYQHPLFLRAHKSYIVNAKKVKGINSNFAIMDDADQIKSTKVVDGKIPIGRMHKENFLHFFHII